MENYDVPPPSWREEEAVRRFELIAPLLIPDMDQMTKVDLRKKIAEQNGVSARTLKRYEKRYQEGGLKGLAPDPRSSHGPSPLPENFDTLLKESIELRRELPDRSVDCIIRILECEERIPPGVLKRPTLQRHMYDAGFGQEHMKQYLQARESSPKRYCMPHRMMMLQADIKESGGFHVMVNGKSQEIYLSTVIDDHSRFILWSKFYENETAWIVEDSFRGAFLKYGRPKKVYCDRGSQYINKQLRKACAELMIRISYAPRKSGKSKGVVEKFHQVVDAFLAEASLKGAITLDEVNHWWSLYLNEMYLNRPHEGIREYYKQNYDIDVSPEGITPRQEWDRDKQELIPLDAENVRKAFLHEQDCKVDNGACIRLQGRKYTVKQVLIGHKVKVYYDPRDLSEVEVFDPSIPSFKVRPMYLGEYAAPEPKMPEYMTPSKPTTSRLIDALEKKYGDETEAVKETPGAEEVQPRHAISFVDYKEEDS